MELTDVRIEIPQGRFAPDDSRSNLLACFSLIFDDEFAVHCVKLIQGEDRKFLAMPAEKKLDHCPDCRYKNYVMANFCNNCGARLEEDRHLRIKLNDKGHIKLYNDLVHPVTADLRDYLLDECLETYFEELDRPGTHPPVVRNDFAKRVS